MSTPSNDAAALFLHEYLGHISGTFTVTEVIAVMQAWAALQRAGVEEAPREHA